MNKTLLNIKTLYSQMGNGERKIADYILSNESGLTPLSISELAEKCGCGDATVVRFSRRLGFKGYQGLKIALAKEEDRHGNVNESISAKDSPEEVFKKVCDDIYCSLEKTQKSLSGEIFAKVCEAILSAKRVLIYGLGNSAAVAMDFAHKLLRIGYDAVAYSDNHMQAISAAHVDAGCVVVGISHSGSSRDIIDSLNIAKSNGAITVAITNIGKSPIYKVVDYALRTVSDETTYSIFGMNARIAQLALIDAIYCYIICQKQDCDVHIEKTIEALQEKKF